METRTVSQRWADALLTMLLAQPLRRTDLISVANLAYCLAQTDRLPLSGEPRNKVLESFGLVVRALLGLAEFRSSLAARLPVFIDEPGGLRRLDDATVEGTSLSERSLQLAAVMPSSPAYYELMRSAAALRVHKSGVALAFDLPLEAYAPYPSDAGNVTALLRRVNDASKLAR